MPVGAPRARCADGAPPGDRALPRTSRSDGVVRSFDSDDSAPAVAGGGASRRTEPAARDGGGRRYR